MTAVPLLDSHKGCHCRKPASPVALFFRRALRMPWRERAVPADVPAGAAAAGRPFADRFPCCEHCASGSPCDPRDNHPKQCSDGCNAPALGDRMLSEVREQWNAWHDDMPAQRFKPSAAMDTGEFAVLDAKVDAVLPRPVNGQYRGTQPRRQPVYGERCQLDVERDMALAAGERARGRYQPATPALLQQVLNGLRKMKVSG